MPYIIKEYDFDKYKKHLVELISKNQSSKEYIKLLYTRLKEIERPVKQELLTDSEIYSLFTQFNNQDEFYYDLICMRIARFEQFSYQSYFENVFKSNDGNIVKKIAERIEYYTTYGDILLKLENMNFTLYKLVTQKLTENHYGISTANIAKILNKYEIISKNLELPHKILLSRLDGWSEYAIRDITISNITHISVAFFKAVHTENIKNELTDHCMNTLDEYLKSLTKEQWIEEIKNKGFAYQTIEYSTLPLQHSAVEALEDVIKSFVKSESDFTNCTDQITYLIEKAEKDSRSLQSIAKDIRDIFTNGKVEMTTELFSTIGVLLLKRGKLEQKTEALRTVFPNTVVDSYIDLLLQYSKSIKKIIQQADTEEVESFAAHLISMSDKDERALELIKKLGLSQSENKENTETNKL